MPTEIEQVTASALRLPANERAALAHRLIATLEELPEADVEALWIAEAERRSFEIDRGDARLLNAEDAFRSLHALLDKCR